jgi:hypothetical protein
MGAATPADDDSTPWIGGARCIAMPAACDQRAGHGGIRASTGGVAANARAIAASWP